MNIHTRYEVYFTSKTDGRPSFRTFSFAHRAREFAKDYKSPKIYRVKINFNNDQILKEDRI